MTNAYTEDLRPDLDAELRAFLEKTADVWAQNESHKQKWVSYMTDSAKCEKVVNQLIQDFGIQAPEEQSALDIGSGFGNYLIAFKKRFAQACGIDIEESCVEWSKKRVPGIEAVQGSATELPWQDESFDLAIATDVFEHIDYASQVAAAAEIKRVLKPGKYGYVSVPNRYQIRDEHNMILFGTWLPDTLRERYAKFCSEQSSYTQCWERTGQQWKQLFEEQGFQVTLVPKYLKGLNFLKFLLVPPNRYNLYLVKSKG